MASQRVLITGASSGIGRLTARRLRQLQPDWEYVLCGRDAARTDSAADELMQLTGTGPVTPVCADLGDLAAVDRLGRAQAAPGIILILAAGVQHASLLERSRDGIEETFAVNVLANVALIDAIVGSGVTPRRIVLFSSGTHDPAKRAGLPVPMHADADLLAYPDRETSSDSAKTRAARAYTASKLAVAMLAPAYARALPGYRIDALDPQLTPGTGLARAATPAIRLLWHTVLPALTGVVPFMNRPMAVADCAVALALDASDRTGRYMEVRKGQLAEGQPSPMARDATAQARLLADCRRLIADVLGSR